jgi:hypothetical protein
VRERRLAIGRIACPRCRCIADVLLLCGLVLGTAASIRAQTAIITVDAPGAGTNGALSQGTYATSVNSSGVITGYFYDSTFGSTSGGCHGFIRNPDGTYITFDSPMSPANKPPSVPTCAQPASINQVGVVTGWYTDASFGCSNWPDTAGGCGGNHGFLRMPNGAFITFDAPTELQNRYDPTGNTNPGTFPKSITSAGEVTGIYASCGQASCNDSFLRKPDGTFVSFDPPSASPFYGKVGANSINVRGVIAGSDVDNTTGSFHGFLRAADGTFTTTDPPDAFGWSIAVSINSSGEVAGSFTDSSNITHGYLRASDGSFTVFDPPGACYTAALGLNNKGTIVGTYAAFTGGNCYANIVHLFLRAADGTFTTFEVPGAARFLSTFISGQVLAISSSNAVVGTFFDANGVAHGFLRPGTDPPTGERGCGGCAEHEQVSTLSARPSSATPVKTKRRTIFQAQHGPSRYSRF